MAIKMFLKYGPWTVGGPSRSTSDPQVLQVSKEKGWNYLTHTLEMQNQDFHSRIIMFLITVSLFDIAHVPPGLNLVHLSWQFVPGDIFSSNLWVFGHYFCDV